MGNTESLGQNQDKQKLQISADLLQNFEKHITVADHAVVSLANAVDAMSASCLLLKQEVEDTSEEDHKQENSYKVILETISECISANKDVMIQAVKELFRFLVDTCKCFIDVPDDLFKSMEIYACMYSEVAERKLTDSSLMFHFFQRRIKQLEKEIEEVKEMERLKREESENLLQRLNICEESNFIEDVLEIRQKAYSPEVRVTEVLKNKVSFQRESFSGEGQDTQTRSDDKRHCAETYVFFNNHLPFQDNYFTSESKEAETSFCASQDLFHDIDIQSDDKITQLKTKIAALETEKHKADEKIKSLGDRKIVVQVARSLLLSGSSKMPEMSLMKRLTTSFATKDIKLEVVHCSRYGEVQPDVPLLLCCNKFDTRTSSLNTTLAAEGYRINDRSAVIIFHQTQESSLSNSIQNYKKYEKQNINIFHAGYMGDLHDSKYNTETVNNMMRFLLLKSGTSVGEHVVGD